MLELEMQLLDVDNKEHQEFTFNILKERALRSNIEIKEIFTVPTFDEHVLNLKKHNYIVFYIISYKKINFAEIYFNKNYEVGMYINHHELKKIIKQYKITRTNKDRILHNIFFEIIKKHKKDLPYVVANINSKNILSKNTAKALGFTSVYESFVLDNKL